MKKTIQMLHIILLLTLVFQVLTGCDGLFADYNPSSVDKLKKVFNFPDEISESSGIIIKDSLVWTFNDSGNDNSLYAVDMNTGLIVRRLALNASNRDWEDIAQDEDHIYIGDFGNNAGNRTDLCIYILDKSLLKDDVQEPVDVQTINFFYEDQTDFFGEVNNSPYDCESLFVLRDSLYLFTKNWTENMTNLYRLPTTPGTHEAHLVNTFGSDGLITGADFNPKTGELVICGYRQYVPYIIYFTDAGDLNLNEIPKVRTNFPEHFGLQIEGVAISDHAIYLSSENSLESQAFFSFTPE